MKVLWVNNIAIPQIMSALGENSTPVGGWMVKLADELSAVPEMEMLLLFPFSRQVSGNAGAIRYGSFVSNRNGTLTSESLLAAEQAVQDFGPDVIHIFGTEYRHSYQMVKLCEKLGYLSRTVISIQGLVSVYARHYTGFLSHRVVYGKTPRDILKGNVFFCQKQFAGNGQDEIASLQAVRHIIGRTDWDRAAARRINPDARYHVNNEMLRESFYRRQWDLGKCERHSIFFSQATNPIKGLHLMLEALEQLRGHYAEVHLYIAGKSYEDKPKYKLSYYEKFILDYIRSKKLKDHVTFTGFLDEEKMCERYLKSHVFVSASSIENSPNSVCEAMLLGVPVVSSMVGGVANLLTHGRDGFYYQADAPYMLAYYVEQIFGDDTLAQELSGNARKTAWVRHGPKTVLAELLAIYQSLFSPQGTA